MAQEVEHHYADPQIPPVRFGTMDSSTRTQSLTISLQVIPQGLVKLAIVNDQVRFGLSDRLSGSRLLEPTVAQ